MPKPVENTERIATFIPKDALEALKILAKDKGMSISGYIRLLILEDVSRDK